jgi:hypothetical protein
MTDAIQTQGVLFSGLCDRPVDVRFDQPNGSSDGGAVLLKAADERIGLSAALTASLIDRRHPGLIDYTLGELLRQRLFGIACGYEDCNDTVRLGADPVHQLLAGRPVNPNVLMASQPTLSRFENAPARCELSALLYALAETVIVHHRRRLKGKARRITIDLDGTDDTVHGDQQLSLFNGYYNSFCYLPLLGFLSFDDAPGQFLFTALLRPGNAPAKAGALGVLKRLVARLRAAFPGAILRVRLDAGFTGPEILDFCNEQGLEYIIAIPGNDVLREYADPFLVEAMEKAMVSGRSERVYGERIYKARSWSKEERVIIKAEVVCGPTGDLKPNPRFVITNLRQSPKHVYERTYCPRGDSENRIKELKGELALGRLSCSSFRANALRVILSAAAFVLWQEIRRHAAGTPLTQAQVGTLREKLVKLGARVTASTRRIFIQLPASCPYRAVFLLIAAALGANTG